MKRHLERSCKTMAEDIFSGISVALALSLSASMHRDQFVLITYIIVVFSILIQGLTIGKLAKKLQY